MSEHEDPFDLNPIQRRLIGTAASAILGRRVGNQAGPALLAELGNKVFVSEVLDDAHLADATLRNKAEEMSRVLALALAKEVSARTKAGGQSWTTA